MQLHSGILTALMFLLGFYADAQSASQENMPINWDNGDVTILKDLGNVWIYKHKSPLIKKARIWEIQKERLTIVYECGGSLHDLPVADIEKITAGHSSRQILYFDGITPKIKIVDSFYYEFDPTEFKVSYSAEQMMGASANSSSLQTGYNPETVSSGDKNVANDTIQYADGSLIAARITLINTAEIKYIRRDIPNSPVYTVINDPQTEIKRYPYYLKIILKN